MTFKNGLARARAIIWRYPLGLALLLGLILRLIGLESRSLQYDDVFSIFLARRSLAEILSGTAADTMPPLYYFLLHFWMLIGGQAWFIRLLSVFLTLLAIFLVYRLGEYWFGREAAAWAAGLAAISPLLIYHGQDVRMYALLVTAQLGYLWFFSRVWEQAKQDKPAAWNWVGLVLCGAAAMYSHNVAVFGLVVPNIFLLLQRKWALQLRLITAQLVIGVIAAPWLLLLPGQIAKVQKAWTLPTPGVVEVLQALVMFTANLPLPVPLLALALLLSLQIMVMLGLELRRMWRAVADTRPGIGLLLALFLVPPTLLFLASYVLKPVFIPRAFLVSSLALDLLGGVVIARTWSRGVGKLVALGFILAATISLPSHYTYNEFPRSPYRAAVTYLAGVVQPGERVIHETKLSYFSAAFYAPRLEQVFLADPPDSPNDTFEVGSQRAMKIYPQVDLAAATDSASTQVRGVYFVTFSQVARELAAAGVTENPNLHWLNDHYRLVERKVIQDLEIYHFER
jgi:mannosyltransferase